MTNHIEQFVPAPTRNLHRGWTSERQRRFIAHLAENGSVFDAATAVGMSPRSAYHLRARDGAEDFARAWDMALRLAGGRLLAHAFERALKGGHRRLWKNGELTIEEVTPSDRLLIWLLRRIGPEGFRDDSHAPTPATRDLEGLCARFRDLLPEAAPHVWEESESPASPPSIVE